MYGHRFIYISGLTIFTGGSLLCSLSWSVTALIAFRFIQALGAGMMMSVGPAIITDIFPPQERGKALGVNASSVSAGLLLGPVLGGILTGALHWRWIFYINLPIGILAIILSLMIIKEHKPPKPPKFDILGAFAAFVSLLTFLAVLNKGSDWGWSSDLTIGLFATCIVFMALFIYIETKAANPMFHLSLFRNRLFLAGNFSAMISYIALFTMVFLMPFYLIQVLGMSSAKAGLILAAVPALNIILAPISGIISDKIGSRAPAIIGMSLVGIGLYELHTLSIHSTPLEIIIKLMIPGIGTGIFQTPNNSAVMGSVPRNQLGIAAGTLSTLRNVGMMFGISISGSILVSMKPKYFADFVAGGITSKLAEKLAFVWSLHDAFLVGAALCVLGMIGAFARGPHVPAPHAQEREKPEGI